MKIERLLLVLCVLVLVCIPTPAHADVAPPQQPPGANPEPGSDATQVRMVAETVLIDVTAGASSQSLGQARVTADFTMRNLGQAAENMAVRFPLGADDGWGHIKEITGLQVNVAGRQVLTHRIQGEDPYFSWRDPAPWASFDVTFPPGADIPIRVEYNLEATGESPFIWFSYVLSSGAGWKDTIGSADIIVRLPYDPNDENILGASPGGVNEGHTIRWHYDSLEPTTDDNFGIRLVMPSAWQRLLAEQDNVARDPSDGEAWGRLGKVCKEIAFSSRGRGWRGAGIDLDPGAQKLYQQSLEAYDKAVTLLPKDALWHAGYADLLAYHAVWAGIEGADTTDEALHAIREIHTALDLAPMDAKVQEIAGGIAWSFPDGMKRNGDIYDYPWLTATPTPLPRTPDPAELAQVVPSIAASQVLPSATAQVLADTPTPTALAAQTASPAATPKPSLPVCGSALLLPLALVAGAFVRSAGKARRP